jgi:hypothetical protein
MDTNTIQFSIDELRVLKLGGYSISGRCSKGPIAVGDTFDQVLDVLVRKTPEEYATVATRVVGAVRLRVDHIRAYGRELETIDQGLTAEIVVSGSGGDSLKIGHSIGGVKRVG